MRTTTPSSPTFPSTSSARWTGDDTRVDAQAVAHLLAVASHDLPLAHWLVPEPRERTAVLARYLRIRVDHALEHGHVDTVTTNTGRLVAAAVWLHSDPARPTPAPYDYDGRVALACRAHAARFHDLDAGIDACLPHDRRHHQLAHWGVHPEHRGRGYGTSLLTVAHDHLDTDRVPAVHVHPGTPSPNGLLRVHGYLPRRRPEPLPHHGPTLWSLWRNPATTPPSR